MTHIQNKGEDGSIGGEPGRVELAGYVNNTDNILQFCAIQTICLVSGTFYLPSYQ